MNDDLGPNKARLIEVASTANPVEVLVDLGVRDGASSFAMLNGAQGCHVIGVDPSVCPFELPERYTYMRTDSVSAAKDIPSPLFAVFFDTLHIKEQVMAELFHYWPKIRVGGWAVFHDTEWGDKRDHYLNRDWEPPMAGVQAFFAGPRFAFNVQTNPYVAYEHRPVSWGMTFVQKLAVWMPEVDGMEQALADSKRLTEALLR